MTQKNKQEDRKISKEWQEKEWWEKEDAYKILFESGRQAKDLYKYIPEKFMEGVTDAFSNEDGYWIYLDKCHVAYDGSVDCGMIHEYSIKDLKAAIKTIRKGER